MAAQLVIISTPYLILLLFYSSQESRATPPCWKKLADRLREAIRLREYSYGT